MPHKTRYAPAILLAAILLTLIAARAAADHFLTPIPLGGGVMVVPEGGFRTMSMPLEYFAINTADPMADYIMWGTCRVNPWKNNGTVKTAGVAVMVGHRDQPPYITPGRYPIYYHDGTSGAVSVAVVDFDTTADRPQAVVGNYENAEYWYQLYVRADCLDGVEPLPPLVPAVWLPVVVK